MKSIFICFFLILNWELMAQSPQASQENTRPFRKKIYRWELPQLEKKDSETAKKFNAKILGVRDGNTLHILYGNKPYTVLLADIDAPERTQYFGSEIQQKLSNRLYLKTVSIEHQEKKLSNRIKVILTDSQGNINDWMVQEGMAWCLETANTRCFSLQKKAREQQLGLWQQANPSAPWEYRKRIEKNLAKNTQKPVNFRKDPKYLSLLGQAQESTNYKENELQKKEAPFNPKLPDPKQAARRKR